MRKLILISIFLSISGAIFSQGSNTECDSAVYFMVQQMPIYIGDYNMILDNISQLVDSETKSILKNNNTNIITQVNCKGFVIIPSKDSTMSPFYKLLENEFNKLKWIPGRQGGKIVNVSMTIPVRIINNKINIPINFKNGKGELIKCKISDENSKIPISNVQLITKYNNCSYYSNQNGEVEFYCEANDEIEINHINYQPFSFNLPEKTNSFQIKLTNVVYMLENVDLTINSPKKLPYKKNLCNYEDWKETKLNQFAILGLGDFYAPETAVFIGGIECFCNYIVQKFIFPELAFKNEYSDTVEISFTITEDGLSKDLAFSKQLNYGIDSVLNKLFIEMPKWRPATQSRNKTEQRFIIKLIFGSNKYWKEKYG
jgi:hypothetical protein